MSERIPTDKPTYLCYCPHDCRAPACSRCKNARLCATPAPDCPTRLREPVQKLSEQSRCQPISAPRLPDVARTAAVASRGPHSATLQREPTTSGHRLQYVRLPTHRVICPHSHRGPALGDTRNRRRIVGTPSSTPSDCPTHYAIPDCPDCVHEGLFPQPGHQDQTTPETTRPATSRRPTTAAGVRENFDCPTPRYRLPP